MLLKDCYEAFGGDYEDVRKRISKDEIIQKFLIKFLSDASYSTLCESLEIKDYVEAFRAAHSLKGISQNFGFKRLEDSASRLTELLRNSEEKQIDEKECEVLFAKVSEDYKMVTDAVKKLEEA